MDKIIKNLVIATIISFFASQMPVSAVWIGHYDKLYACDEYEDGECRETYIRFISVDFTRLKPAANRSDPQGGKIDFIKKNTSDAKAHISRLLCIKNEDFEQFELKFNEVKNCFGRVSQIIRIVTIVNSNLVSYFNKKL